MSFALIVVKISSFIPTHHFLAVYCLMELLRSIESSDDETLIKRKRKFKCFGAGKVLVALLIVLALILTVYLSLVRASEERKLIGEAGIFRERSNESSSVCYFTREWNDGKTLSNVIEQSRLVASPLNILFHETSCSDDGVIRLTSRQACAVESAARNNPKYEAFVLFTSQVGFRNKSKMPIIDAVLSYPNVHLNYLNITQYAEKTPLEKWLQTGELFRSKYRVSHTSDVLRYLSLWKFGGIYLDLDTVSLKPLNSVKPNFAGAESTKFVAAGIINLQPGHKLAELFLQDLLANFNGENWGNNGPGVITRVLQKYCSKAVVGQMISTDHCENFHVLPIESCYAIRWEDYMKFMIPKHKNEALKTLKSSIIAHVWNKLSQNVSLNVDSNVAYIKLAKKHCPRVLAASNSF